jgi:hypothetical protein
MVMADANDQLHSIDEQSFNDCVQLSGDHLGPEPDDALGRGFSGGGQLEYGRSSRTLKPVDSGSGARNGTDPVPRIQHGCLRRDEDSHFR